MIIVRDVVMDYIDPPVKAVRMAMNEGALQELQESMATAGLQVPIKLRPVGERFEVVYGHRRFTCAQRLGWETIPAIIEELSEAEMVLSRYTENHHRDDVNPVEDAFYLSELIEKGNLDEEGICKLVKKSPDYIARRLAILRFDEQIIDSLAEGKIVLGAAEILNKITNPEMRRMYLYHAISGEHSVATVRLWYSQWKQSQVPGVAPSEPAAPAPDAPLPLPVQMSCEICGPVQDTYNLRSIMVHNWEVALLHKAINQAKAKLAGEVE